MDINTCTFTGHVTRHAKSGKTSSGQDYLSFGIAIDESNYDAASGTYVPCATFIDLMAFGELASRLSMQLHIGTQVAVSCYLRMDVAISDSATTCQRPVFFVTSADVGTQPKSVRSPSGAWDTPAMG